METIRKVYDEINAMGGRPDQNNSYDQGIVDTVAKVLEVLEREYPALLLQERKWCSSSESRSGIGARI